MTPNHPRERVEAIRSGQLLFDSRGVAKVKVTREGQPTVLEIPIRSTGIWELMEALAVRTPRPSARAEWIAADSDLGRQLGLTKDRPVLLFDTTDVDYLNRLSAHHREVLWQVVLAGLEAPILNSDGEEAATFEERRRILKEAGLTEHQATQIFKSIQDLTRLEEEREDFFSARP